MEAFRPMDDYPPDRLKEDWNDIPESAKKVADWTYPWVCGNCAKAKY